MNFSLYLIFLKKYDILKEKGENKMIINAIEPIPCPVRDKKRGLLKDINRKLDKVEELSDKIEDFDVELKKSIDAYKNAEGEHDKISDECDKYEDLLENIDTIIANQEQYLEELKEQREKFFEKLDDKVEDLCEAFNEASRTYWEMINEKDLYEKLLTEEIDNNSELIELLSEYFYNYGEGSLPERYKDKLHRIVEKVKDIKKIEVPTL